MLDINLIREHPKKVKENQKKRGRKTQIVDQVAKVDGEWREAHTKLQELQHTRNEVTKQIAELKSKGKSAESKIKEMRKVNKEISQLEEKEKELLETRDSLLKQIPNMLHPSVPQGKDDTDNVEIRKWGEPEKREFKLKAHQDLLADLNLADFEQAAKVSGRGFNYLFSSMALLDLALQKFAIDQLLKKGFTLTEPPLMLRKKALEGVVDMNAFQEVVYKVENEDLYLIGTSEHPLVALHADQIVEEGELPLKYAGISPCFRKEIGAHGVDTRGLFRMHQFNKVEQVVYTKPENSWQEFEKLQENAEKMFQKLEIPYRVVNACTGDLNDKTAKMYDIEAWMPRQEAYKEVGSCSNCTDYQARNLDIRLQRKSGDREPVHTLNSTAIATSRTMVAILENNQQKDGTVEVPKILRAYMNGVEALTPREKTKTF